MRATTWLLFCLMPCSILTTLAGANPPTGNAGPQADSWVIDAHMTPSEERRILSSLNRPVQLDFKDEPLLKTVRHLTKLHPDCRLAIDVRSLEEIGLSDDVPITIHFSGTLGQALEVMLDELDLTLCLRGNVLWLTTVEASEAKLATRIYDVTPLLANEKSWRQLMRTIESTIKPDTWEALGGPSTIALQQAGNRGLLVVSAPTMVQLQLQRLLDRLTFLAGGTSQSPELTVTRRATPPTVIHTSNATTSSLPRFRLP